MEMETVILTQPPDDQLALGHAGAVCLQHETPSPLVHMVCWKEEDCAAVAVSGALTVSGDPEAPVVVDMRHHFDGVHAQHLEVAPVEHGLRVHSALAEPIHHALALSAPLQVRFVNGWNVDSAYDIDIRAGERPLLSIHVSGRTVGTPQSDPGGPPPAPGL
jgi:hypothetical protein